MPERACTPRWRCAKNLITHDLAKHPLAVCGRSPRMNLGAELVQFCGTHKLAMLTVPDLVAYREDGYDAAGNRKAIVGMSGEQQLRALHRKVYGGHGYWFVGWMAAGTPVRNVIAMFSDESGAST